MKKEVVRSIINVVAVIFILIAGYGLFIRNLLLALILTVVGVLLYLFKKEIINTLK